jgi:hypothetical protein
VSYDANQVVKDGPYSAPRWAHHPLKMLVAIALYAGVRDGLHVSPWIGADVASPAFMILVTVREWIWPSDVNQHSYSWRLHVDDFVTDASCTLPAVALACFATSHWAMALFVLGLAGSCYALCRKNARP